ncbi:MULTISPECIES: alpha/beta hydrolase [Sphingomonas]|uniref:alpha/beta hydrolase n=1 Tax=Sphingomonas TaxID=13687 RepID=UPI000832FC94|nr:alpha/beta hydrolase-fold protein [Sphingomonas sp. CCH10-B3]MBA3879314.1 enterochelin esterase [Sphingobium sp.]
MIRSLILLVALLFAAPVAAKKAPVAATGNFVELPKVASTNLVEPAHVTIWLPPGYARGKARWPVIYMHDGQNVFFPKRSGYDKVWAADKAMLKLIADGETKGAIIVAVDHQKARSRQYYPQALYPLLPAWAKADADQFNQGPIYSDGYLRFLVAELKPMIDKRYRTLPDPAHTMVAGSSMGGLISLYAITQYPSVFGAAACVSTHWPLSNPPLAEARRDELIALWGRFLTDRLGPPNGRRIWFDHGDKTLDQFYGPYQTAVDRTLINVGWQPQRDFEARSYPGAAHEENAWAARLPEIFGWLLAKAPE